MSKIYKSSRQYWEYTKNTNEKKELQKFIKRRYLSGNFPIRKNEKGKNILDLGCGNGLNTFFIAKLWKNHLIEGVDASKAQINFAKKFHSAPNVVYKAVAFEKFKTKKKYDFILISHVLQHLEMNLDNFLEKVTSLLNDGGEIWIISQTKKGMCQIIKYQQKFLHNPLLTNWKTSEDYLPEIKRILKSFKNSHLTVHRLKTSFKGINFKHPSEGDKLRLEFIFGLETSYDSQNQKFKDHLASINFKSTQRIPHPNDVFIIK